MVLCRPFTLGVWLAVAAALLPACTAFRGAEGTADAGPEASTADGATADGSAVSDAGPSPSTRPSACAACSAAQICCLGDAETTCAEQAGGCAKLAIACGSPSDCPTAGDKCCLARVGPVQGSTTCKSTCATGEQPLCVGPSDCTAPATCKEATNVPRAVGLTSCQ